MEIEAAQSVPDNASAVFLFNHRFERNLDKLDALYADRFPRRTYLMPFARSERTDVCAVHETSWHFSGHVAQGATSFIDDTATHYVFISDDLVYRLAPDTLSRSLLSMPIATLGIGHCQQPLP
jgi:hypothetical protein